MVGRAIITDNLGVTGSITGSHLTDGTVVINGGNISSVTTLTATNLAGTLTTAAQANVTSVGTLTGLTVSGDVRFVFIVLPLYFMPKVPMEATGMLFILNI